MSIIAIVAELTPPLLLAAMDHALMGPLPVFSEASMLRRSLTAIVTIALTVAAMMAAVHADPAADEAAIRQRFQRWTADFNARDAAGVCDLFAPDLVYLIPEVVQGTRQTLCANLATMLAGPTSRSTTTIRTFTTSL